MPGSLLVSGDTVVRKTNSFLAPMYPAILSKVRQESVDRYVEVSLTCQEITAERVSGKKIPKDFGCKAMGT